MTGIPEDFADSQKKKISDQCKREPHERQKDIEHLAQRIMNETRDSYMNPKKVNDALGINLQAKLLQLKAK